MTNGCTETEAGTVGETVGHRLDRGVMRPVAVLFARADSVYKTLPGCEVYDMERDARTYDGPWPVVAHPPCRAWGRLSHMAKPRADERNLARLAVALVREFGGVLEHPKDSRLWPAQGLPEPGQRDGMGGWTMGVTQHWWGHRATKATRLYIVGLEPRDIPELPHIVLGEGTHVIAQDTRAGNGGQRLKVGDFGYRPFVTHAEREHTPPKFAEWLVELARRCKARTGDHELAKRLHGRPRKPINAEDIGALMFPEDYQGA